MPQIPYIEFASTYVSAIRHYNGVPIYTSTPVTIDEPSEQPTEPTPEPPPEVEPDPPILPDRSDDHTGRIEIMPYDGDSVMHYPTIWVLERDALRSVNRRIKTHKVIRCYIVRDRRGSDHPSDWSLDRKYDRCRNCHKFYDSHNGVGDGLLCPTCYQNYARCVGCSQLVNTEQLYRDRRGTYVCRVCYNTHRIGECVDCSCWSGYNSELRVFLCFSCYSHRRDHSRLQSYSYRPSRWSFFPSYEASKLYLGVELETDGFARPCGDVSTELEKLEHYKQRKFYNKADGTLTNGIEIVSHPATLDYHRTQMGWEELCSAVKKLGGKSHYTHTAGLHIHFNESYLMGEGKEAKRVLDVNALKLLYLTKNFWRHFLRFSRRHLTKLNYCKPYSGKKERFRKMTLSQYQRVIHENDRYHSVNLRNPETIEIRWFRGTLNIQTLYASLELVDFLANLVKRHSAPYLYRLTWAKLVKLINPVKYPNLEAYLIKKKLKEATTSCVSSAVSRED